MAIKSSVLLAVFFVLTCSLSACYGEDSGEVASAISLLPRRCGMYIAVSNPEFLFGGIPLRGGTVFHLVRHPQPIIIQRELSTSASGFQFEHGVGFGGHPFLSFGEEPEERNDAPFHPFPLVHHFMTRVRFPFGPLVSEDGDDDVMQGMHEVRMMQRVGRFMDILREARNQRMMESNVDAVEVPVSQELGGETAASSVRDEVATEPEQDKTAAVAAEQEGVVSSSQASADDQRGQMVFPYSSAAPGRELQVIVGDLNTQVTSALNWVREAAARQQRGVERALRTEPIPAALFMVLTILSFVLFVPMVVCLALSLSRLEAQAASLHSSDDEFAYLLTDEESEKGQKNFKEEEEDVNQVNGKDKAVVYVYEPPVVKEEVFVVDK